MLGAMQRRLATAKADMEDLIARLKQESALTEFLQSKVKDLEGELESTRESGREILRQVGLAPVNFGVASRPVSFENLASMRCCEV